MNENLELTFLFDRIACLLSKGGGQPQSQITLTMTYWDKQQTAYLQQPLQGHAMQLESITSAE